MIRSQKALGMLQPLLPGRITVLLPKNAFGLHECKVHLRHRPVKGTIVIVQRLIEHETSFRHKSEYFIDLRSALEKSEQRCFQHDVLSRLQYFAGPPKSFEFAALHIQFDQVWRATPSVFRDLV